VRICNVHWRSIATSLEAAGRLLDTLSGPDDGLWPRDRWPALRLDRPLSVGAAGGHGPVFYEVCEYLPGRKVAFRFDSRRGIARGLVGGHRFELEPDHGQVVIRHVLEAEARGLPWLRWLLLIRPLHDALLEDALDRAERALAGATHPPARWNWHVRLLRWLVRRRKRT
jgi:hypothetical protein